MSALKVRGYREKVSRPFLSKGGEGTDEGGSASVVLMALGLAVVTLGVASAGAGSGLVAAHRAGSAADLSALAAATRGVNGEVSACGMARRLAEANNVQLHSCRLDGLDVVVTVRARVPVAAPGGPSGVSATARAGPVEL